MTDGSNLKTQPSDGIDTLLQIHISSSGSGDIPFLEEAEELFIQEVLIKKAT
ncbi:hypothetical protein BCU41_025795 [Vibrio lentus]|uniref:hypothetical protein n=1 Tax=Vibrio lentus TaxID=136468 RepID=UPI0039A5E85F